MNYWRSSVLVFKTTKKMSRLLRKNIPDEERWRNFWYESEWSTFYLSNEEDEELKQFAEDDQGDMSAGECDGKLVEFLIYFVRTDHCFGSSRTASRYYIRSTVHCTFCLKARRLILIIVKCETVLIFVVMKLYWPTFTLSLRVCLLCAEEAVFNGRLFWRCEDRPEGGAIEFMTIVVIESLRCYFAIFARTGYVALISSWSRPCWWGEQQVFTVVSGSLHYFTDVVLLVGARGKRGCAHGCVGGDVEERGK